MKTNRAFAVSALLALTMTPVLLVVPDAQAKPVAFCLTKTGKFVKGDVGTTPMRPCSASQSKIVIRNSASEPGPQGPRGRQGPPGPPGADGIDGIDGIDGKDGSTPVVEDSPTVEEFHIEMDVGAEGERYLVAESGDLAVFASCWEYGESPAAVRVDWYIEGPLNEIMPQQTRHEFFPVIQKGTPKGEPFYLKDGPKAAFFSTEGYAVSIDAHTLLETKHADCVVTGTATTYEP